MKIYFIPGLGADERMFAHQSEFFEGSACIRWVSPGEAKSLEDYTGKLAEQVDSSSPFVLVGVSMGGMIALELAKVIKPKAVFLISSAKGPQELPWAMGLLKVFPVHRFFSPKILLGIPFFLHWLFGVRSSACKKVFGAMLRDIDDRFVKWAVNSIVHWKKPDLLPISVFQLHGDDDHVISCPKDKEVEKIGNGGHMMVFEQSDTINHWISQKLCLL